MPGFNTPEVQLRAFDDIGTIREQTTNSIVNSLSTFKPIKYGDKTLTLSDVRLGKPPNLDYKTHKEAILGRKSLVQPVHGTWTLSDEEGDVVEKKKKLLANIPVLSSHGTYIRNGSEYSLSNQQRLRFGIYTHVKGNGQIESHFNVKPGTGKQFRIQFQPESGKFYARVGQANLPIIPFLKALGANDDDIKETVGDELFKANSGAVRKDDIRRALRAFKVELGDSDEENAQKFREVLSKARFDPEVNERTAVGTPYDHVSYESILNAMDKIVKLNKHKIEPDNRDSMPFQAIHSHEDLFSERIANDSGGIVRQLMWKVAKKGTLDALPSGIFNKHIDQVMLGSGLGQLPEETNVTEVLDNMLRVTRLGEGAIGSLQAVPDDARAVQSSFAGWIDPIRTPESAKAGVDNRFTIGVLKGSDGKLYAEMLNAKTGKNEMVSSVTSGDSVVAFPGEFEKDQDEIVVIRDGKISRAPKNEVDYIIKNPQQLFTAQVNLMPLQSTTDPGRVFLGAKFISQSLPLKHREAPLVRITSPSGKGDYETDIGRRLGSIESEVAGMVLNVTDDFIEIETEEGPVQKSLANYLPHNRKTFFKHFARVKPGDIVKPGDLLAASNITNDEGTMALGTNLRVGYIPFERGGGANFEDGIVISEAGADKLAAEQMYMKKFRPEEGEAGKDAHVSVFPGTFNKEQLDKVGKDGLIKPGSTVNYGDPVILAVQKRAGAKQGMGYKKSSRKYRDVSVTWDHEHPGFITDTAIGPKGTVVAVQMTNPIQVGDKLSGRSADKGIVSAIIPNEQMPQDAEGHPLDIIVNPLGVISRGNPSQIYEAALGKVARKTGKHFTLPSFTDQDYGQKVREILAEHGIKDKETIFDPVLNRNIPNVVVGDRFYMRLHHLAESKMSGRSESGRYSSDGIPAKGGGESAPRFGLMEVNALLSAGATDVLNDSHNVRSSRNEDYWRAVRMGFQPPPPKPGAQTEKFLSLLRSSGINVERDGTKLNIMAATDADVDKLAVGEITKSETVKFPSLEPIEGGLFDRGITGAHGGTKFGKIELGTKIPNPVMEDPVRLLLDLTKNDLYDVIAGEKQISTGTGPEAIEKALSSVNVEREKEQAQDLIKTGKTSVRDNAIKKLRVLEMFEKTGLKPQDMMISKVAVLPPAFRPISVMENDVPLVNSANLLYKDLLQAKENYLGLKDALGEEGAGAERLAMYQGAKAVIGLGDPINKETKERRAKGLLEVIFGDSPKCYDRKTEVLTESGWVMFKDLTPSYKVAAYNPETGSIHYENPQEITNEFYNGKVLKIKGRNIDSVTTLNHKHYAAFTEAKITETERLFTLSKFQPLSSREVFEHPSKAMYFKTVLDNWEGKDVTDYKKFCDNREDFITFCALYFVGGVVRGDQVVLETRSKTFPKKEAERMLSSFKFNFKNKEAVRNRRTVWFWYTEDAEFAKWVRENLGGHEFLKKISDNVKNWDKEALAQFLYTYFDNKAYIRSKPGQKQVVVRQEIKEMADDIQEIGFRAGVKVHMRPTLDASTLYQYYNLSLSNSQNAVVGRPYINYKEFVDRVYSCTVSTGFLVVRRNGCILVSGNSGLFQRQLMGKTVNLGGRAVITPDPNLSMDQVGIPEEMAWKAYAPFVMKRLVRRGMTPLDAAKAVKEADETAKNELINEMGERPVIVNRAPSLHRFSMMGAYPVLSAGKTIKLSPVITAGLNADFDGDTMAMHVPASEEAKQQIIEKMLPSKQLFDLAQFKARLTPRQEHQLGLWMATKKNDKQEPKKFVDTDSMIKAFRRGELNINDMVDVPIAQTPQRRQGIQEIMEGLL